MDQATIIWLCVAGCLAVLTGMVCVPLMLRPRDDGYPSWLTELKEDWPLLQGQGWEDDCRDYTGEALPLDVGRAFLAGSLNDRAVAWVTAQTRLGHPPETAIAAARAVLAEVDDTLNARLVALRWQGRT